MKELFDGLRVLAKALGATNYPKATAVIVAILTGIVCYKLLIYLREEQPGDAVPRTTITNTTSGKQSPIMPDNNGTVTITNGSSQRQVQRGTAAQMNRPVLLSFAFFPTCCLPSRRITARLGLVVRYPLTIKVLSTFGALDSLKSRERSSVPCREL
jgi:hypothetical protein